MRPGSQPVARVAGILLTSVVLWRLGLTVRSMPESLAALSPGSLKACLTSSLESRIRTAMPRDDALDFHALALRTSPEARILVHPGEKNALYQALGSLCYPRRIVYLGGKRAGEYLIQPAKLAAPEGMVFVERIGKLELWRVEGSAGEEEAKEEGHEERSR